MGQVVTKRDNGRLRVQFVPEGVSRTEQSHRDEVNINSIMARYHRSGLLPTYGRFPTYGDFSATGTYHEAMNQVLAAQDEFGRLPSAVRKRFQNDPGKLIDFLSDPGNLEEAVELGLVERPEPAPVAVPKPVSPPAAADGGTPVAAASADVAPSA